MKIDGIPRVDRMISAASMPSISPGMEMSMMTMSGDSSLAISMASCPDEAEPTTSCSSMLSISSRYRVKMASSSAISILAM